MSHASWKDHFKQPISGYDPVEAQGLSELGYALQHNQISQEEFLTWARETFEFASIDVKFFQSMPANKELFQRYKDTYAWGPECMPVAEWDDHVLIAGLLKPEDLPAEIKPIFLLAPIQGLLKFWSQYQEEGEVEITDGEPGESGGMPDGLIASAEPASMSLSFSGVKLAVPETHAEAPVEEVVSLDPEAVQIQVNTNHEIRPLGNVNGKSAAPAAKKPVVPAAKPGLLVQTPNTEPIMAPGVVSTTSSFTMPPQSPKVPPPASKTGATPIVATKPAADAPMMVAPLPILEDKVPEVKAEPEVISAFGADTPTIPNAQINPDVEMDEAVMKEVFSQCSKYYDKQLYIHYSDAGKYALAKYWPNDFVASESPTKHSIVEDSFLSIVAKTQKPYHGYVVQNAITNKFFTEVNSGQTPENITLIPIMKNGAVVGALMGWGPKTTYNLTVLRALEKAVNQLMMKLGWSIPEAA